MKSFNSHKIGGAGLGLAVAVTAGMSATEATAADPKWDTSAGIGLTLTEGNSETLAAAANIQTKGTYSGYAITLGADANYGENSGTKSAESYKAYLQYDRNFSKRFYGFGRAEYYHDAIADIEYRVKLSPGFGWHMIKNDKTTLDLEIGPGYVFQKLGSVEDSYPSLRLGNRFSHKLSDSSRVWQSAEIIPEIGDFSNYVVSAEIGIEADLTKKMTLRTVLQDEYQSNPAAGRKSNDIRLISGINYKF